LYIDIKDTRSRLKIRKLREVLCFDKYDFTSEMINHIQNIHSKESDLLQLADLLLGALSHFHRKIKTSPAKNTVIEEILRHTGNLEIKNFLAFNS